MSTITLEYIVPRSSQTLGQQTAALLAVVLETQGPDNELLMLGGIAEKAPRSVLPVVGPPPRLALILTYASTDAFESYFPTTATQIAALEKFWSERISMQLATTVEASTPVITP